MSQPYDCTLPIRITRSMRAELCANAAEAGLSASEYVRQKAFGAETAELENLSLVRLTMEVGKLGTLYNHSIKELRELCKTHGADLRPALEKTEEALNQLQPVIEKLIDDC